MGKDDMTTTETLRVAIQGVAGCFHDAAAREYFKGKRIEPVECDTFREIGRASCRERV